MKKLSLISLAFLSLSSLNNNDYYFKITAKSNSKEDIIKMYEYKNEIIQSYSNMIIGLNQDEVIDDLCMLYDMKLDHHTLILDLGEGKTIEGKLRNNYCKEDIIVKSYIIDWLKK